MASGDEIVSRADIIDDAYDYSISGGLNKPRLANRIGELGLDIPVPKEYLQEIGDVVISFTRETED